MDKTFDDLKLGDSVWLDGVEMFFAGFTAERTRIYYADILLNVCSSVNVNDGGLSLTRPMPKIKRGQPVWVRDYSGDKWMPRFFRSFKGTLCIAEDVSFTWGDGWPLEVTWNEWKLPTRQELIGAGLDPDAWESRD